MLFDNFKYPLLTYVNRSIYYIKYVGCAKVLQDLKIIQSYINNN